MAYSQAIRYLEHFIDYEKIPAWPYKESLKLKRIKGFLATIGNPHLHLKCLHVAGTKGKGSTCAFIAYILREAGFKVGLYTSPHLVDFRERIRILNPRLPASKPRTKDFEGSISKQGLIRILERLRPAIELYNKKSKYGPLSFFEVYTALAFVYFKDKRADFVVLETGLGGRLDATNVVRPLVCAITPISYEHTQKLGNTLRKIALEKVGIIKSPQPSTLSHKPLVISAPQEKEVVAVIRDKCKQAGARLYEVGRQIKCRRIKDGFGVSGLFGNYQNLKIKLIGKHQFINATVAVGVIEALKFSNIDINIDCIRRGLYATRWPGRCEVIAKDPLVVLDGAQNIASARALRKAIKENFKYRRLILVLGISKDKDIEGICRQLRSLADRVILTKADTPRAAEPETLAQYFKKKDTRITHSVKEAKSFAWRIADRGRDSILVTGSLFVVGEARKFILKKAYKDYQYG